MTAIFISYRRADSHETTTRLASALESRFGGDMVFRDEDAIEAGTDFSRAILDAVRAASAVLVVIGPEWLEARSDAGKRRLEQPDDFVRLELETAFAWAAPVVPVLVGGANMPGPEALPASIRELAKRNAHRLGEASLAEDIDRLAGHVRNAYAVEPVPTDAAAYLGGRLEALRRYPFNLANLVRRPKRYLATRALGRRRDGVDALLFLLVSTALAVWLAIAEWPGHSWDLFVAGTSVGILATLFFSIPLYAAWRIVGAADAYGRILTVLSYQLSVLHLGIGLAGLVMFGSVNFTDPELLVNLRRVIVESGVGPELDQAVNALLANAGLQVSAPLLLLSLGLALPLWFGVSWGAYRRTLGLTRWRSAAAFAVLVLFALAPVAFASR